MYINGQKNIRNHRLIIDIWIVREKRKDCLFSTGLENFND